MARDEKGRGGARQPFGDEEVPTMRRPQRDGEIAVHSDDEPTSFLGVHVDDDVTDPFLAGGDEAPPSGATMDLPEMGGLQPALPFHSGGAGAAWSGVEHDQVPVDSSVTPSLHAEPIEAWPFDPNRAAATAAELFPPVGPVVRPPNPLRDAQRVEPAWAPITPDPDTGPKLPAAEPESTISLESYARVRVAMWQRNLALPEALAEQAIDEIAWRRHERQQAARIADEARQGRSELAQRVREAIRAARMETPGADDGDDLLLLEEYAFVRAQLDDKDERERVDFLAEEGLTPDLWDGICSDWAARARRDPTVARRVRRAIAKARQRRRARD